MKLWKQALISLLVLVVAAVAWARYFPGAAAFLERAGISIPTPEDGRAEAARGPDGPPRPGATRVLGAEVVEAKVNDAVSAIGDGRALRSVTVTPYVSGRIVAIEVEPGDYVAADAALAHLNSEGEEIALDRARLTLEDSRVTLARVEELAEADAASEVQRREAALLVSQAELALRDAELALARRVIRAPFEGWVGIMTVDIGDQVGPETQIVTLDDRSRILVDFRVPERFIGQLEVGGTLTARPLARPSLMLDGEIVAIDSRIDPDTRTLHLQASLDNAEDLLRAGMAFAIAIRFPGEVFAAVDPLAIQWSAAGAYVWIGVDGKAERVPVRIIQRNNDYVLVDADLAPGALVVTEGSQLLRQGAPFAYEGVPPAATAAAPAGMLPAAAPGRDL